MSQTSSMKLLGARNMSCIVERMEWNNKMDLIAYGTEKGERARVVTREGEN